MPDAVTGNRLDYQSRKPEMEGHELNNFDRRLNGHHGDVSEKWRPGNTDTMFARYVCRKERVKDEVVEAMEPTTSYGTRERLNVQAGPKGCR